jgi:hypothetical protein
MFGPGGLASIVFGSEEITAESKAGVIGDTIRGQVPQP